MRSCTQIEVFIHKCLLFAAVQCLGLTPPLNALITYSSDPPYEYLTTATYECNVGFGLLGGDKLRSCIGGSDEWTGVAPSCTGVRK